ncbi:RNA polymerase sigma factor [Steroidobacter sp.]|uniref:RNA polymerase sigma factor n=1 Tax=Steroidobacter sp. TaxID=1978227 RepID=UPI0025F581D7|nr:RNA polymerase sigma factor [Steroidobacter sp.]
MSGATSPAYYAMVRQLFREHNRALINFLLTRLPSEQEALDVAQEAYVKLLQLDHPDTVGFLRGYLFRIAANLSIDRLRHRRISEKVSTEMLDKLSDIEALDLQAITQEEFDIVCDALNELPARHKEAFVRHVIEGYSTSEIARELAVDERTVRKFVARGLLHCRQRLDASHRGQQ